MRPFAPLGWGLGREKTTFFKSLFPPYRNPNSCNTRGLEAIEANRTP